MTERAVLDGQTTVRTFLLDLSDSLVDEAIAALADDVVYTNVGLATLRGRRATARVLGLLRRPGSGFAVELKSVAAQGDTVLTERIDELRVGRLRIRFWVCGRFDVHDGRIVLWRDYFDNIDIAKGLVRGILALAVPAAQRPMRPLER